MHPKLCFVFYSDADRQKLDAEFTKIRGNIHVMLDKIRTRAIGRRRGRRSNRRMRTTSKQELVVQLHQQRGRCVLFP